MKKTNSVPRETKNEMHKLNEEAKTKIRHLIRLIEEAENYEIEEEYQIIWQKLYELTNKINKL